MRNYLDSYMRSLAKGEQVLARDFIWSDRRFLARESESLMGSPLAKIPRFQTAIPMQLVSRYMYASVLDSTKIFLDQLYNQANKAAHIRTSLNEQVDKKLERIESALQKLEQEVDDWEELLCMAPEAVHTISRDFGTGLRPVVETPTELELISLIIESNVPTVTAGGYISVAIEDDRIDEPMFTTLDGLQLRYIYTFTPGLVDKIHLEPITGIGEITMIELRVYGSQGNLISTITEDEVLNRTLDYSIPKTMVSRIEIDIIDRTYVIEEITTTTTVVVDTKIEGETRTVIPGKKEKVLIGYDYEKLSDKTEGTTTKIKDSTLLSKPSNPTSAQQTAFDILTGKYGYSEEKAWDLAARLYATQRPADYVFKGVTENKNWGGGSTAGTVGWDPATGKNMPFYAFAYKSVEQGMRATSWASGFLVRNPDGTYTSYSWKSRPTKTVKTPGTEETTKLVPIYDYIDLPDEILIEPFSSQTKTSTSSCSVRKRYHYEGGLRDLVCSNSFYTELLQQTEVICFEGGIPTYLTMTTDEHLPHGAHINFWMIGNNGELINVLPEEREFTTDVLRFDQYGKALLKFYPEKELYYYKDEEQTVSFPTNGRYVMGPSNNLGAINTLGGSCFWARYQPNHSRANYIPYTARVASYVSPEGILGETFESIPDSSKITLRENPYVDTLRLDDSTYSPIQVVIDGYNTMDLTNYYNFQEDEFPVEPRYEDNERMITYKTRGKTIFFEEPVDRPVRIFYEYVRDCVKFVIEMGVTNQKAACPVLYSYSLSYV